LAGRGASGDINWLLLELRAIPVFLLWIWLKDNDQNCVSICIQPLGSLRKITANSDFKLRIDPDRTRGAHGAPRIKIFKSHGWL
jgi:hypothetical protein